MDVYQEVEDDLTLEVYDLREELQVNFKYRRSLFHNATIQQFLRSYLHLLQKVIERPCIRVGDLDLVDRDTRHRLLAWSAGPAPLASSECDILAWIDEHEETSPEALAVVSESNSLTYGELCHRSREIADNLARAGVARGDVVAICMPRSTDQIVVLLGILRQGAAYLPLDPDAPSERVAYQLEDSCAAGVFYSATHFVAKARSTAPCQRRHLVEQTHALAYVIYTSGTTGRPKGVRIRRDALANLCKAMITLYEMSAADRVLQFASLCFDMSVEEIFPTLVVGATLVLRGENDLPAERLSELIERHRITIANLPPSYHLVLLAMGELKCRALYDKLRIVSFGGDKLIPGVLSFLKTCNVRVFNAYGPTECTVNASVAELTGQELVHIGTPIAGTQVYILDERRNLVLPGVKGELCIAGMGVSAGYIGNAESLTTHFISNPFGEGVMYCTGDSARWLQDGTIELFGRLDDQLSVHGYRVEPVEIEDALRRIPGISQAVAVMAGCNDGTGRLVAFYTADRPLLAALLKCELRKRLPAYFVPQVVQYVTTIPITAEGKVDRQSLARWPLSTSNDAPAEPPRTDGEQAIAKIFADVLGHANVGRESDFFDLGGHSLHALQIVGRLERHFDIELRLRDFFDNADVATLASFIEQRSVVRPVDLLRLFVEGGHEVLI